MEGKGREGMGSKRNRKGKERKGKLIGIGKERKGMERKRKISRQENRKEKKKKGKEGK